MLWTGIAEVKWERAIRFRRESQLFQQGRRIRVATSTGGFKQLLASGKRKVAVSGPAGMVVSKKRPKGK